MHARWMGRCTTCGEWNTVEEQTSKKPVTSSAKERTGSSRAMRMADVKSEKEERILSGIAEFDRALGGGAVRGGVTLLGGDPGIGKSTLLMQALAGFANRGERALYITGEESAAQVSLRARRLRTQGVDDVLVLATTDLDDAEGAMGKENPGVVVIDSIQTLRSADITSAPGSVSQIREVASRLIDLAKRQDLVLFLIGHVTKEGSLAGPKVLEHLVDTVLSFEGDRSHAFRVVRAVKNRFGPAHELGVFEMATEGLVEVDDPSKLFLAERAEDAEGSVVVPIAESTRPMLIELQALVAPTQFGSPRRVVSGIDGSRLAILLAVLERRAGVRVLERDVFASVAGGARVEERAADLALSLAVTSSTARAALPNDLIAFGEVGLTGEIRAVPRAAARVGEARAQGFTKIVLPKSNAERLTRAEKKGVKLIAVDTIRQAIEIAFQDRK